MSTEADQLLYEYIAVSQRVENVEIVTRFYANLFQQRGMAELDYAKKIDSECKSPIKDGNILFPKYVQIDVFDTNFKNALNSFNTNSLKCAEKHRALGVVLIEQVAKPLENLYKTLDLNKKRVFGDFNNLQKNSQGLIRIAEKAKAQYLRSVNEYKEVSAQLNNAMTHNVQMVDRLVTKKQQVAAKVKRNEEIYKQAVENSNKFQVEMYGEPMKKIINSCIELINTQYAGFKNTMEIVSNNCYDLAPAAEEAYKALKEDCAKMNYEEDFAEFVKANAGVHKAFTLEAQIENVLEEAEAGDFVKPEEKPAEEKKEEEKPAEEKKAIRKQKRKNTALNLK